MASILVSVIIPFNRKSPTLTVGRSCCVGWPRPSNPFCYAIRGHAREINWHRGDDCSDKHTGRLPIARTVCTECAPPRENGTPLDDAVHFREGTKSLVLGGILHS